MTGEMKSSGDCAQTAPQLRIMMALSLQRVRGVRNKHFVLLYCMFFKVHVLYAFLLAAHGHGPAAPPSHTQQGPLSRRTRRNATGLHRNPPCHYLPQILKSPPQRPFLSM